MLFIPAIDIIDGQCVRLYQGDYAQKKDYGLNPFDTASNFFFMGVTRLHIVDLNGADQGKPVNHELIIKIAKSFPDKIIEVGGGIRNEDNVNLYLENGISKIILGTQAVRDRSFLKKMYNQYKDKIVLGLDMKNGKIKTDGWQKDSGVDFYEFLEEINKERITPEIIFTDIKTDGTLKGPAIDLIHTVCQRFPSISFVASGGIASLSDVQQIKDMGYPNLIGMISGKAIYEKRIELKEALDICQSG